MVCSRCGVMRKDIASHIRATHYYADDAELKKVVDTARRGMYSRQTARR